MLEPAAFDSGVYAMEAEPLFRAVAQAAASGKIGTPVALRLYAQLQDSEADLVEICGRLLELALPLFAMPAGRLLALRSDAGPQWNLLLTLTSGATLSITIGCVPKNPPSLQLLCVGNQGVMRLEGGENWSGRLAENSSVAAARWRTWIETSARTRTAIDVEAESR
jgi:hypothetical protein